MFFEILEKSADGLMDIGQAVNVDFAGGFQTVTSPLQVQVEHQIIGA